MKFGLFLIVYFLSIKIRSNRADIEYLYLEDPEIVDKETENLSETKICGSKINNFWSFIKQNVDINKDSKLDPNEIFDSILNQIKKTNEEDLEKLIKNLDTNGTGRIEFDVYMLDTFGNLFEELKNPKSIYNSKESKQMFELETLFRAEKEKWYFISSKNNSMTYEQFYKFIYSDEFRSIREFEADFFFEAYDQNKDTLLDYNELIDLNVKELDLIEKKIDLNVDLNGDNFINRHEFALWWMPSIEQHVFDEKQFLFTCCDSDKDGFLNKSEVIYNCKMFLKSQLTDYGKSFKGSTFNLTSESKVLNYKEEL